MESALAAPRMRRVSRNGDYAPVFSGSVLAAPRMRRVSRNPPQAVGIG